MRTTAPTVLFLVVAALAAGCGWRKTHLLPKYGASVDGAIAAQARPRAKPAVAVKGLDPQEAAIISEGYRARLAPPGADVEEPKMILVAPQDTRGQKLAPSVPRE
jgi:hypothetical protein